MPPERHFGQRMSVMANPIGRRRALLGVAATLAPALSRAFTHQPDQRTMTKQTPTAPSLDLRQQAIVRMAALAAAGDMAGLGPAIGQGLDAGLTVSEAKEVLVQLYAYAGFPRSLNALGELMKLLQARQQAGLHDAPGAAPSRPAPVGQALLEAGTANQTRLSGSPVQGPLFDFAPAIANYLKTHLFGDIFERDNLDWASRELATVGMLSALPGAESQLQSHLRIAMNVGVTADQLHQLAQVLDDHVDAGFARRTREALARQLTLQPGG
ncbi:MAG: hypothetical protein JWQ88_2942 [Rhodoferax sp.]|nr:hypothetical protein [Rhodoferax sp.]